MDFPLDSLPPLIKQTIINQCKVGNYPIESVATSVLAIITHSVQGLYNVCDPDTVRDKTYPLSQYFLVIANSGDAKSSVYESVIRGIVDWQNAQRIIYKRQCNEYTVALEEWERQKRSEDKSIDRVKLEFDKPTLPRSPSNLLHSPTSKAIVKALANDWETQALFSAEAGSFLGGYAMGKDERGKTAATLTSIWDNGKFKNETGEEKNSVPNGRLSILLMAQPEVVSTFINDPLLRNQGIQARFHVVTSPKWKRVGHNYTSPERKNAAITIRNNLKYFNDRVFKLLTKAFQYDEWGNLAPPVILWSGEAEKAGELILEQCNKRAGLSDQVYDYRLWEHTIRMAGVIAAFSEDQPEITSNIINAAFEIVKFYAHHWATLDISESKTAQDERLEVLERRVKDCLRRSASVMTLSEIVRSKFKARQRKEVSQILENLVAQNEVIAEEKPHRINGTVYTTFRLVDVSLSQLTPPICAPATNEAPKPLQHLSEAPHEPVEGDAFECWLQAWETKPAPSDSPDVAPRVLAAVDRLNQDHAEPDISVLMAKVRRAQELNAN